MNKYRVTADLTGNTNSKFIADIDADNEDDAWAIAYKSQLPRGIYNGKVEELPTRAELSAEIARLREVEKAAKEYFHKTKGLADFAHIEYEDFETLLAARALEGGEG